MANDNVQISFRNGVRKITLNKPKQKNALSKDMYKRITSTLNKDAQDDSVVVTIITGAGEYYSSGNDVMDSMKDGPDFDSPKKFIQALIDYPKLIIAVINGPAIGIATTTCLLCDIVYASDRAYFSTPFLSLGLCAEGTSSYMFPRILGRSKASEAIFLTKQISAEEAYKFGLISEVIPHEKLDEFIEGLYKFGNLPVNSVKVNKALIMHPLRNILTETNKREFDSLETCIESEEFIQAVTKFMQRKSKL